ncbi:MAG: LysR family transcriptional regulator [Rhodobacteraceae bacterium]|nr:LysR family transcriptional regulator [Paracoccaceae bacterium]
MAVSPPRPSGPPLDLFRAFEAATRHGNFIRAADEPCVTSGAIVQQIKGVEAWMHPSK